MLFPVFLRVSIVPIGAIDDLCLTCTGNDMAPAICDGDTVRVKICTNGTLIQAGPKNSTHPGDIIVYCAAAAVSMPKYMWMCGRAVNKHRRNGYWYFKTQIDSSSEPDAWEVPEYYLLGIVAEVIRGTHAQSSQSSPDQSSSEDLPRFNVVTLVAELIAGIMIGAVIGAVVAKTYMTYRRPSLSKQMPGKFRVHVHS